MAAFQLMPSLLLSFLFLAITIAVADAIKVFDVKEYGAVADGETESSKAFLQAWSEACACASEGKSHVVVPKGSFLVGPLIFKGPCKAPIVFQVVGDILAPTDPDVFPNSEWVEFQYLSDLTITGQGKLDGRGGVSTWARKECLNNKKCKALPTSLKLSFVNNTVVQGISSIDSKMFHMLIFQSHNINIQSVKIIAPGDSPNTDGIHIGDSTNVTVVDSNIGTGDDCVSIGPTTAGVTVSNVLCGPGHGISVGSLGKFDFDRDVTGVNVTNCTFTGTTNGVRIKSWQDSYELSASDFTFDDIVMNNVSNPIIIDQEYCPMGGCGGKAPSRVKISNVKFVNIRGTSFTNVTVNLKCSKLVPCKGVELNNINLAYNADNQLEPVTSCSNVVGKSVGTVFPPSCI